MKTVSSAPQPSTALAYPSNPSLGLFAREVALQQELREGNFATNDSRTPLRITSRRVWHCAEVTWRPKGISATSAQWQQTVSPH